MMTLTENNSVELSVGTLIDNLEIVKVLSIGAYGQVYMARDIYTLKRYAVKSLPHNSLDSRQYAIQRNEITLHSHLSGHPHIIRLEKVVRTTHWTHAVLEYGSEGDLFSAITEKNLYYGNHQLIKNVFLQLIDAVRYCHDNHIYHRDLKPENILVFNRGRTIKLTDFGLATTHTTSTDYGCGSTFYFSPECQGDFSNSNKKRIAYATAPNDVWALGVILINLSAGRNPWRLASLNDDTFRAYVRDPSILLKILPISLEVYNILQRIFCLDPLQRMTLDELYSSIQHCTHFTRTAEVAQYEEERKPMIQQELLSSSPGVVSFEEEEVVVVDGRISSSSSDSSFTDSELDITLDEQKDSYLLPEKGDNLDPHYIQVMV
ncbi:MAG: kinase-like domain-containing protein [Benjaminiella poitrasii]|nr:MAG: kinase-like domain-containing protein [Benjaminiella poitrasii]